MAFVAIASAFQGEYLPVNQTAISTTFTTTKYTPNPLFSTCACDLTSLTCDKHCCCDFDCPAAAKDSWSSAKKCVDVSYKLSSGGPLSTCVEGADVYSFNQLSGLYDYVTPINQLLCVKINNSPQMNFYYNEISSLTDAEKSSIAADPRKQGLGQSLLEQASAS